MENAPNHQQRRLWNELAGPRWVRSERVYDHMIAPHGEVAVAALDARPGDRVLDVGCGFGTTALHLADVVGPAGRVVGVDISTVMVERARDRSADVANAAFLAADAQTDDLAAEGPFDRIVSRFGVMFFDDPSAAFANLRDAAAHDARLAFVCWQGPATNPFFTLAARVVRPLLPEPPAPPHPTAPGPLSFCDPERVATILTAAGWRSVDATPHELPMRFGVGGAAGVDETVTQVFETELGRLAREQLDDRGYAAAVDAVHDAVSQQIVDGVVTFDSAIWCVTATAD